MHVHLDPLGGVAGDMFAAALVDARPELVEALAAMVERCGLARYVTVGVEAARSGALAGRRVLVRPAAAAEVHHHRHHREVRALIEGLDLDAAARERALDIFSLLARAEARVHDVEVDRVSFHEVGAWDSIADVVMAAWLIEQFPGATWSCSALPLGAGRVRTEHGPLPVPAPATALLLEGLTVVDDGVPGERVTPTGAAILRHLDPAPSMPARGLRINASGTGCGSRELEGLANVLRALILDEAAPGWDGAQVAVLEFEVDDQTPEDLAVALDKLRAVPSVLDAIQSAVQGKKGRVAAHVRVLVQPGEVERVLERCFVETTTLGVRWNVVARAVLRRESGRREVEGHPVGVKHALRPDAVVTRKAEMDDVAGAGGGHAGRERLRRAAEETGES